MLVLQDGGPKCGSWVGFSEKCLLQGHMFEYLVPGGWEVMDPVRAIISLEKGFRRF